MGETFRIKDVPPARLEAERARVLPRLKALLPFADVGEVGSTAVAGAIGKGDLDILVTVRADDFPRARAILDASFARNPAQLSNAEFQGYHVPSDIDVAIQMTVRGGRFDAFDEFIDVLRSDAGVLRSYNALKRAWDGKPMADYRAAKARFIEDALRGASRGA